MQSEADGPARIPASVRVLGVVSLLMDTSSEFIHSLLPILMASVLGAGMAVIGVVEGIAEAIASLARVLSGFASDRFRNRKTLLIAGYGLAALSKPVFPMAGSIGWIAGARWTDRLGKGLRGAPRDALIADITPPSLRGAAYGLRQSLDSLGAVLGPLLAILFMALLNDDLRTVLWIAAAPAALAVGLLAAGVREPAREAGQTDTSLRLSEARALGRHYWTTVLLCAAITLARFSEAFLVLRADSVGLRAAFVPAVLIVMSAAYAAAAYPAGVVSDRTGRQRMVLAGMLFLVAADVTLALAGSAAAVMVGALLWGLHLALTQGLILKLVADAAPGHMRATAFGISGLANAAALLAASALAGLLWQLAGPAAPFTAGASIALAATIGILMMEGRR